MTPDICLLVEGTYPYVTGGVSTWLQSLISNLPEFTFTILHLGSKPEAGRSFRYQLPPNVVGFQEVFLNDASSFRQPARSRHAPARWRNVRALHDALAERRFEDSLEPLQCAFAPGADRLHASDLLYAQEAWDLLVARYEANSQSIPFLNYFWAFRSTHLPLFVLNDISFPRARIYHTVSTGYAGYAAALGKLQTGSPLLMTEHGIYTREREMEIALATWFEGPAQRALRVDPHIAVVKSWWTAMFRYMSKFSYHLSDCIISITKVNQQYQRRDGADPSKLRLIPNGVDINRFSHLRAQTQARTTGFTVGFVGRIVPIKDVKTFIQAIKIASATITGLRALLVGPTDEDDDYFEECQALSELLELDGILQFVGRADVREFYPQMDVVVLSSLSEAQPLVILEANCAGIPVVASDVGACRDLLEGITDEDRALGPSGLLTLPASPHETAGAMIRLWQDDSLYGHMAQAGPERVKRFYAEDALYAAYRELYQTYLQQSQTVKDHP